MKTLLNKHLLLLMVCLLANSTCTFAQTKKYTINGYIREKGSRESLIGVNIFIPKLKTGTVSNNYGFYSITLPSDTFDILFSYIGYQSVANRVFLTKNIELNIDLESSLNLSEVVVTAEKYEKMSETPQMSVVSIPIQQIKEIPAFLGEKDVFKVLQLMPGVQKGSEGSSGIYVRGGGPDQNLIILDDATVYNASHLFGFFSLFNGDAIKSVELTKGGFPARYGGRLSSVIEMNMKDGNKNKFCGEAGIGIIASRLMLEGPIIKDKASFLFSGRRTYVDALIYPFMPQDMKGGYYFYDFNTKLNYDFGRKNKIYLSGYFGRDKFYMNIKNENNTGKSNVGLYWENATATARWNHLFTDKLFSNTSFIFSNYKFQIFDTETSSNYKYSLTYTSGIRDFALKYDMHFLPSPEHQIRFGLLSTYHSFTPSAVVIKDNSMSNTFKVATLEALESGVYAEDEIKIGSIFTTDAGFRISQFLYKNKNYLKPEPRLSLNCIITENLSIKASYALMNQFVHLLSNTGIGLPTDLWVPSTDTIAPQTSHQVALGIAKDFEKPQITLTIEGYYKKSFNTIGFKEGASFLFLNNPNNAEQIRWEDNITRGEAKSYGTELLLQRKAGKLTGWIGYTLSWTYLHFPDLNFGEKFFAKYDRRHDVSVVAIYKISKKFTVSSTWVYGTGNAISLPMATYEAPLHSIIPESGKDPYSYSQYPQMYTVNDYGKKNSFRMAPYHLLDISVQYHKTHKYFTSTFEFSIYNAYNRKNPFYYYTDYDNSNRRVLKQISIFPILPSISYNIKF